MRTSRRLLQWLGALLASALASAPVRADGDATGGIPLPFIPVPLIDIDPNSGATFGLIPTWLTTDADGQIRQIVAPDINRSPNFGFGGHARVIAYPADDVQWSVVAGGQQRVERLFDCEFQTGRLRRSTWAFDGSVVYDRDGSPRFFGIGNRRLNLSHEWQLAYTMRARDFDVLPGTLDGVASIGTRFPTVAGLGGEDELLHRLQLSRDTRDDPSVPRHGAAWTLYGGIASSEGVLGSALYSDVGLDWRELWSAGELGESQPLRGFGTGRFYDRNSLVANLEYRRQVLALDILATHIEVEMTPLVVGYVDFGYGSQGVAAFTGINYPF